MQKSEHVTHHMKFLNQMYKYEMDPASMWNIQSRYDSIERRMDGRTDGWMDSIPRFQLHWNGDIITKYCINISQVPLKQNKFP